MACVFERELVKLHVQDVLLNRFTQFAPVTPPMTTVA